MKDHGSFGPSGPSPAKNFSVGDWVVRIRPCSEGILRVRGLYQVKDAWIAPGPFLCDPPNIPALALEGAEGPSSTRPDFNAGRPYRGWRADGFRLAFTPDPDVARERTDLSEPAQPKTHAGERARKRVGANQGDPA